MRILGIGTKRALEFNAFKDCFFLRVKLFAAKDVNRISYHLSAIRCMTCFYVPGNRSPAGITAAFTQKKLDL